MGAIPNGEANIKTIVIIDDHPMFREALLSYLMKALDDVVFEKLGSIREASRYLSANKKVDLVLLDLNLDDTTGVEGLVLLRKKIPKIPISVISGNEQPSLIQSCYAQGASCFIKKSYAIEKIVSIIEDKIYRDIDHFPEGVDTSPNLQDKASQYAEITSAEMRVMIEICRGKSNKEIAATLCVSLPTVKAHVSNIMRKTGAKSRAQIILQFNQDEFK